MLNRKKCGWGAWIVSLLALPAFAQMSLPGKFEVTDTGAASYTIPISMVPGTAGLEPKLSLQYDSRSGNGLLGVGWSLSGLPSITRCGRTIAQDGAMGGVAYDANDRFCLDGQRLIAVTGTYGADQTEYRTERESFSKVVSYGSTGSGPSWFKVWTKAGLVMEFGNTPDSRIEAQGKASARVWAINKTSDTKGNYFLVSYTEDNANGEYRPARIDYTGNGSTAPGNFVRFVYEVRPDIVPLYQAGSLIKTTQRMIKLEVWQGEALSKEYKLFYTVNTATQRSNLSTVTLCVVDAACFPAISLGWSSATLSFEPPAVWLSGQFGVGQGWSDMNSYPRMFADVNGDGLPDIVGFSSAAVYVSLNNGTGYGTPQVWLNSDFTQAQGWTYNSTYPRMVLDVNGDGLADIVGFPQSGVDVALSSGSAFLPKQKWLANEFGTAQGWSDANTYPRMFADVNGDGLPDIVGFSSAAVHVSLNSGTSYGTPQVWLNSDFTQAQGWTYNSIYPRMVLDVNGDGLADIVGFPQSGVDVALSSGGAFLPKQKWLANEFGTAQGWSDANTYPRMFADVNGDGLPDIVGFSSAAVHVSLNSGTSYGTPQVWLNSDFTQTQAWTDNSTYPRMVLDVNGDGLADIVGFPQSGVDVALSSGSAFLPKQKWLANEFGTAQGWTNSNVYPRDVIDVKGIARPAVAGFAGGGVLVSLPTGMTMPDQLATITNGTGSTVTVMQRSLPGFAGYTCDSDAAAGTYPILDISNPLYVVDEVKSSNGLGGEYRSTYRYAGAKADQHGRGFLGFRQMTVRDEQTGVEQVTAYRQDYPFTGLVGSREKTLGAQLLNRSSNSYSATDLGGTRRYPFLTNSLEESWELSGAALPAVTTGYQYDAFGNATQVGVSTGDGHAKTTVNTYSNDAANWLLGRLTRSEVTSTTPGN